MRRYRMGTAIAFTALVMAFVLAIYLKDPTPFTVVSPVVVGGKWAENFAERWGRKPE